MSRIRVIRVGGSLLTWNGFVPAFATWLHDQPQSGNILIAGGGPWVELLRQAADRFDLDDEVAHWLCVQMMSTTAALVGNLLNTAVISQIQELPNADEFTVALDVEYFLKSGTSEERRLPLPPSWEVTSDSIAARVADTLNANELVLLKSQEPSGDSTRLNDLAEAGYVDRFFPVAAKDVRSIRYVNLRCLRH